MTTQPEPSPPNFDPIPLGWFTAHGIDGRGTNTTSTTDRLGQPLNPHTGHPITIAPGELDHLVHLLAQLYETDPDPKE